MYHMSYHSPQVTARAVASADPLPLHVRNEPGHHEAADTSNMGFMHSDLVMRTKELVFGEMRFPLSNILRANLSASVNTRFRLSYVDKNHTGGIWRLRHQLFDTPSSDICHQWVNAINSVICQKERPRNLLVFVNPFGGNKSASSIYSRMVSPVFSAAAIRATVITTDRGGHASDFIKSNRNLSMFDGVIAVGGDGFFHEVMNAMIETNNNHIRLGLIPGGSTNTIVYSLHGSLDASTAAMHIALGERMPLDLCRTSSMDGQTSRYTSSMAAYGFYADNVHESESLRWMGPARYDLSGLKAFLALRSYKGTIRFKRANNGHVDDVCMAGCRTCRPDPVSPSSLKESLISSSMHNGAMSDDSGIDCLNSNGSEWETRTGEWIAVNTVVISCKHPKAPNGMAPHAHLSDGTVTLVMIRKCTQPEYLYHLTCLAHEETDHFEFPFVETAEVTEFVFEADDASDAPKSQWMADGELLGVPDIHCEAVYNLIHVFGSRPPLPPRVRPNRRATAA